MRRLTWLGLILSAIWVGVFVWMLLTKLPENGLTLNEWGDFLSGGSAPLALLWLVIGFFQQGKELALNTAALKAQQEELRQQVEQTRVLAENAARQANASERQAQLTQAELETEAARRRNLAQAIFVSQGGSTSGSTIKTGIVNIGADVTSLRMEYDGSYDLSLSERPIFKKEQRVDLVLKAEGAIGYPIPFRLCYRDNLGEDRVKKFEYWGPNIIKEVTE